MAVNELPGQAQGVVQSQKTAEDARIESFVSQFHHQVQEIGRRVSQRDLAVPRDVAADDAVVVESRRERQLAQLSV